MNIRKTFLLIPLLMALRLALAEPVISTVAVYDFIGTGDAATYKRKVTALITADLTMQTNLAVIERAELTKALSEQAFGISGLVSSDAAAKIGQITGVKILVSGQIIGAEQHHLILVANIIGTETGRLFAAKVEGSADSLLDLASELASKIATTIAEQKTNLLTGLAESRTARIERILKKIKGKKRPSVLLHFTDLSNDEKSSSVSAETEFGSLLLQAGFPVVDEKSEKKPDIEITGGADLSQSKHRSGLFSYQAVIELKVQERQTGNIIAIDRQESSAIGATKGAANRAAQVTAIDALAERLLPLMAK